MNRREELIGSKTTKNYIFILPLLDINYRSLPINFLNSYIYGSTEIALVFNKIKNNQFDKYLQYIKLNKNFVEYREDLDEIILIFQIPERYHNDFELFKQGKYSKFSKDCKDIIVTFHGIHTEKNSHKVTAYNTVYPQEFKRKQIADELMVEKDLIQEVFDKPDLEEENFIELSELLSRNKKPIEIYDNK